MVDYKNIYKEEIIKLYNDYIDSFKISGRLSKKNKEEIIRMNELLHEINELKEEDYQKNLQELTDINPDSIEEKLGVYTDIANLIKSRIEDINDVVTKHESVTKSPITFGINVNHLTSKLDEVGNVIDLINKYLDNEEEIKELTKVNEDTELELNKLNDKKELSRNINIDMERELNYEIEKLISEYYDNNISIDEVKEHYMQYQELYLKAKEQVSIKNDNNLKELLTMAKEKYAEYSLKNAIINLKNVTLGESENFKDCYEKRQLISKIINEGLTNECFDKLSELINEQNEKLNNQNKDLKREELLLTVKKNNEEKINLLKEENNKENIMKIINNESIKIEEETPTDESNQEEIKEEIIGKEVDENKPNNFKLVELEPVPVIKKEVPEIKKEELKSTNNMITKVDVAPNWLMYSLVENEHKFINWFDKLNALIRRKKYLRGE